MQGYSPSCISPFANKKSLFINSSESFNDFFLTEKGEDADCWPNSKTIEDPFLVLRDFLEFNLL